MPNSPVFPTTEEEQAGGGLELWTILSPGTCGQGVLSQGFSPGWGLQMGLAGPVGMSALTAV